MDATRFDALTRALTGAAPTRRRLLAGAAGGARGALAAALGVAEVGATHFGCLHVAKPCRRAGQCCSGICRGPRGKKTCRGHGAGTCKQQGQELICTAPDIAVAGCNNDANCFCVRTTAGTNFCYARGTSGCAVCERDADCEAQGFPAGSACASLTTGRCAGGCESGTACVVPCGAASPAS